MKQKKYLIFKKLSLLFLLFGTIIACTNDEFINNLENSNNYKKTRINLEQLKRIKPNAANKVIGFKERKANRINSRTIHDQINGFSFNTDNMLLIENGSQYWLTVPIIRDSIISNAPLENLLLTPQSNGNFLPLIIQYQLTESDKILLSNNQPIPNILSKTTINSLDNYDSNLYNNVTNKIVYSGDPDYSGTIFHDEFGNCYVIDNVWQNPDGSLGWDYIQITCPTNTGGSGGSDAGDTGGGTGIGTGGGDVIIYDGTGSSGSGTSGSTSSDDGFGGGSVTSPTGGGLPEFTNGFDPCVLIKKLQQDTNFKGRMANLITAARNYNFEKLHTLSNALNPTPTNNFTYGDYQGSSASPEATFPANTGQVGVIHSHYVGLASTFSAGDLQGLYNFMSNNLVTNSFFYAVVVGDSAYILQVKDRQAFINFGNKYLSNDTETNDFMKDMYNNYNIKDINSSNTNEENFLKMLTKLNTGLYMSSINFGNQQPSPNLFNNWTNKLYNSKTRNIETSNCN